MANIGYATLSVIPSFSGFQRNLDRGVSPGISSAGRNAGRRFGGAFGSAFRGTLGAIGVFQAGSAALRFLGDSVAEGRESVRIGKQTAAVIKSTGGSARVSEKQAGRLANTLKRLSGVDDELIQGSENVLLTFKNIRNEQGENNKIFDKATKASLNLSKALGKDLNSSSLMVGKALNDPVAGMTALGRAGVQFSADQKDAIKKLVETGDTLGAQKMILRELNSEFKGSARAQRTEADRLSTAWGDFKEQIGKQLIPVLDDLATFLRKKGIPRAKEFFGWVRDEGVPAVKDVAKFARKAAGDVKDLVDKFETMPGWVKKVLIAGGVGAVAAKKFGAFKLLGGDNGIFSKGATPARPMYVFVTNPGFGGAGGGLKGLAGKSLLLTGATVTMQAALVTIAAIEAVKIAQHEKAIAPNTILSFAKGPHVTGGQSEADKLGDPNFFSSRLNHELDLQKAVQNGWTDSKAKANDYLMFVRHNQTTELKFTVTGFSLATKQAQDYYAKLLLIRDVQKSLGFSGDGTTAAIPGQVPNHSGSKSGGGPVNPRGVTININGDVKPYDSREFFGDLKKRSIAASSDGVVR